MTISNIAYPVAQHAELFACPSSVVWPTVQSPQPSVVSLSLEAFGGLTQCWDRLGHQSRHK